MRPWRAGVDREPRAGKGGHPDAQSLTQTGPVSHYNYREGGVAAMRANASTAADAIDASPGGFEGSTAAK